MKPLALIILLSAVLAGGSLAAPEGDTPSRRGAGDRAGLKREPVALTEEQQAELETRVNQIWSDLSLREKAQVIRLHEALTQMPPEERRFIHDRLERFVHMTPEERQRLKENAERWRKMTPEERQRARDEYRQRRAEFEERWRREHPGEEPPPGRFRGPHRSPREEGSPAPADPEPSPLPPAGGD